MGKDNVATDFLYRKFWFVRGIGEKYIDDVICPTVDSNDQELVDFEPIMREIRDFLLVNSEISTVVISSAAARRNDKNK